MITLKKDCCVCERERETERERERGETLRTEDCIDRDDLPAGDGGVGHWHFAETIRVLGELDAAAAAAAAAVVTVSAASASRWRCWWATDMPARRT